MTHQGLRRDARQGRTAGGRGGHAARALPRPGCAAARQAGGTDGALRRGDAAAEGARHGQCVVRECCDPYRIPVRGMTPRAPPPACWAGGGALGVYGVLDGRRGAAQVYSGKPGARCAARWSVVPGGSRFWGYDALRLGGIKLPLEGKVALRAG